MILLTASLKDEVGDLMMQRCAKIDIPFNIYIAGLIIEDAKRNQAKLDWAGQAYLRQPSRQSLGPTSSPTGGTNAMQETAQPELSPAYEGIFQAGVNEGRIRAAKEVLLKVGTKRLGPPTEETTARIEKAIINDLERWVERLFDAKAWDDLFAWR